MGHQQMCIVFIISACLGCHAVTCPSPECSCAKSPGQVIASCDMLELKQVPDFKPDNKQQYHLLNLSFNGIVSVQPYAFSNVKTYGLDFSFNQLENISPRAFQGFQASFRRINLFSNKISAVHWGLFRGMIRLEFLDFTQNRMFAIPRGLFQDLQRLDNLMLSWNKMRTVEDYYFTGLFRLTKLYLMGNRISTIKPRAFSNLQHLKHLSLNSNRLNRLSPSMFRGLQSLIRLDLEKNYLFTISHRIFDVLTSIEQITLLDNNIRELKEGNFASETLEEINLAKNNISSVSEQAFAGLKKLVLLHLNGNNIEKINKVGCHLPAGLETVREIWLQDNPLLCDCTWSWLSTLKKASSVILGRCSDPSKYRGLEVFWLRWVECRQLDCAVDDFTPP